MTTVGELIEQLARLDKSMPVGIAYEYGDYYDTIVAEPISEVFTAITKKNDRYKKLEVLDEVGTPDMVILGNL
jgi:hypothetical protein